MLQGTAGWVAAYGAVAASAAVMLRVRGARPRAWLIAPLWALGGVGVAALLGAVTGRLIERWTAPFDGRWLEASAALASLAAVGVGLGVRLSPRRTGDLWRRGAVVVAAERTPPSPAPARIRFAGLWVPASDETKHFKVIGTTGTGKSTAIRALLTAAIARGDRAVISDAGGAYLRDFYDPARGDVILNPFDPRAHRWDPFLELSAPFDADLLARALIGDVAGAEQSWRQYARGLLASLLRRLHAGGTCDLGELCRLLHAASVDELRLLLDGTPAQPLLETGNERMLGSVRAVLSAAVASLEFVRAQTAAPFSVRRWVEAETGVLFLPYAADQVASLQSLVSAWMRLAILQAMAGGERDRRLWFLIDELDALGAIDGLKDALARLRKFGGRCVLGFQSIAQVEAIYGAQEAQTIVENCGNTLILRCSAAERGGTARFASALIGEREVVRAGVAPAGAGGGLLIGPPELEPAVLPSEIEQLADFEGFVKLASQPHWRAVRLQGAIGGPRDPGPAIPLNR